MVLKVTTATAAGLAFTHSVPPSPIAIWVGLCVMGLSAVITHLAQQSVREFVDTMDQ